MDIVYRLGRASAQEVLDNLADPPSYSAVRALLRLLEERGHVRHVQEQGRFVFLPAVPRREARRQALSHVVATFFGGSVEEAMLTLVESSRHKLSSDEIARLAEIVERARKEGK
jgi:BlaI family transcriptional regulator, penicillinase repressor